MDEVIKLLEEARKRAGHQGCLGVVGDLLDQTKQAYRKRIALLKKQTDNVWPSGYRIEGGKVIPDCKPEPRELTVKMRKKWEQLPKIKVICSDSNFKAAQRKLFNYVRQAAKPDIDKLCDIIDRLTAENKRLRSDIFQMNDKCVAMRRRLEAEKKALSEKIRGLEELIEHIKNILSAAIERPDEIAIDWKEFLLKSLAKP